jgi:hypothetical protein
MQPNLIAFRLNSSFFLREKKGSLCLVLLKNPGTVISGNPTTLRNPANTTTRKRSASVPFVRPNAAPTLVKASKSKA